MSLYCPICCDDEISSKRLKLLKCCRQRICDRCIYKHIKNVLQEGVIGDGRRSLVCPMGCGSDLSPSVVMFSIREKHFSYRHHVVGMAIVNMLQCTGVFFCLGKIRPNKELYFLWYNRLVRSRAERADLLMYERWSISVALLNRSEESRVEEEVIRCPAPNCPYLWFGAARYRNRKRQNEPNGNGDGSITALLLHGASHLFYQPLPQEDVIRHWVDYAATERKDGRKLTCPSCKSEFCGLCRRPWTLSTNTRKHKRLSHKGKTCGRFANKTSSLQVNDYMLTGAKMCPGCSMLVHRISGCNHMTCVCGMNWCYICECRWHVGHYSCTDDSPVANTYCSIS